MEISDHGTRVSHVKDASSIREALRMIADDKEEKNAPRSERKPADVVVSIPDDHIVDDDEMVDEHPDDDPAPDPPTNRKTAKGSEKASEDKKPRTATITPEILPDEPADVVEAFDRTQRIIDAFVIQCEVERFLQLKAKAGLIGDGKSAAKHLRKLADKLDPPTKFRRPESDDVLAMLREYSAAKEFIEKYGNRSDMELAIATEGFIDHYDGNGWLIGKAAMKDWRATARKWLRNQPQFTNGSNGNGKAKHNGRSRGLTADEVFS
jgi:hypothetical protein